MVIWALTCTPQDKGMVLVNATASSDGDVVEASGHQRVKHTLRTGLGNHQGVNYGLVVSQCYHITVHLPWRWTPGHAEEIHTPIITDRDLADSGRDCRRSQRLISIELIKTEAEIDQDQILIINIFLETTTTTKENVKKGKYNLMCFQGCD